MPLQITIELQDADLQHFIEAMQRAQTRAAHLLPNQITDAAQKLLIDAANIQAPHFIAERLSKLKSMIDMVHDTGWGLSDEDRQHVLAALTYFADPDDVIPDHVPVLGFLDDAIMLEHSSTQRNIRVDTNRAMLSGNSEVSCLNTESSSDENDCFVVECDGQPKGSVVTGKTAFMLKNSKLGSYLYTSKYNNFHEGNCGNRCPILGQLEVSAVGSKNANCRWKVDSGVFIEEEVQESGEDFQEWVYDESDSKDLLINTGEL